MRSVSTPHRKPRMTWPAVTVARMVVSLRSTKTNTPLPTLEIIGGENRQLFFLFLCGLPIDKPASMWYNSNGVQRAGVGRPGPNSRSVPPYANFLLLLATFIWPQFFPKSQTPRKADRESAYVRFICVKPIGLLLFSSIIIISYFFIKINPIGSRFPDR